MELKKKYPDPIRYSEWIRTRLRKDVGVDTTNKCHEQKDAPWEELGELLKTHPLFIDGQFTKRRFAKAGEFMYMQTQYQMPDGKDPKFNRIDSFKHRVTRNYVYLLNKCELFVPADPSMPFKQGYFGEEDGLT